MIQALFFKLSLTKGMEEESKINGSTIQNPQSNNASNIQPSSQPLPNGYPGNPVPGQQGQIPPQGNPQGGGPQHIPPSAASQYSINTNTFLDDEEFNLNIDDIDLEIKTWSKAISSAMIFLKAVLVWRVIRQVDYI
jgi:hypothetical protein